MKIDSARVGQGSPMFVRALLALGCAVAGACGGGAGSSPPTTISFATASGATTEGAGPLSVPVVLHTTLPSLSAPASIDVVDIGSGTATSAADYTAFAPTTVTFPIGSVDGATQSVALTALADLVVEGRSETIKLGLANAVGGARGSPRIFTATVADADQATIQFASSGSTTPDESSTARDVVVRLDLPAGASLGVAASVHVADAGTGSATSGVDYTAFPAQTVTFAAGSTNGTTQTLHVLVLDDATIEIDETVKLALSMPSAGTVVGVNANYQLTIRDDDASGPAALVASAGPTGVETSLAYDDLVDLGTQTVGAGPNAGTRVRIANAGGSAMTLGAPSLTGTNPDDFAVEVELAPLVPPGSGGAGLGADAVELESPLAAAPAERTVAAAPGIGIVLDRSKLAALAPLTRTSLHGFPVPGLGGVTLDLHRLSLPFTATAVLRVDGVDVPGGPRAALGDLSIWSGSALEVPGSRVFLALSSDSSRGFLELPFDGNRIVHFATGASGSGRAIDERELAASGLETPTPNCFEPRIPPGQGALPDLGATSLPGTGDLTTADCSVAIETDYQLYQKFNSIGATTSYVTQLMAAVSDQYFTDVQTTISIAYLGIYTTAADPWTSQDSGGDASALLNEFIAAWAPNHWPVSANLAHFISGANLGGGIAYINALCNQSFGFGVSGNVSGNINWGGWTGLPGNLTWDFVVVAHEMGHNFGSLHTHDYCPPLDICYANCTPNTACSQGTLMSYCHLCGGMDNIDLHFHPVCANHMRQSVNSSCLGLSALAPGDYVQYLVRFNPMTATGQRNANLEFSHDATNVPQPFHVRLRGTAN
jgi:hypothetical protein